MLFAKPQPSSLASAASTPFSKPIPTATNHIATPLASSISRRHGGLRASAASVAAAQPTQVAPALSRVDVLSEALPFIQRFKGKTVVVKYGGAAMKSPELQASVIRDLVLLSCVGLRPVLVHGGGPEINSWLARVGVEPQFRNGLRVTDAVTMEVVEMVLVGKVNKQLVSLISLAGATAVGLCGKDARMLTARPSRDAASLGFVGEVARVDPTVLHPIIESGHIPVIATVAADEAGQAYNINTDTAAGEIAAAVGRREAAAAHRRVRYPRGPRRSPEPGEGGGRRRGAADGGRGPGGRRDDSQGGVLRPRHRAGSAHRQHHRRPRAALASARDPH